MADMGLEERWKALGDAVDAWLDREAELDRLTDPGAAERWRAVSGTLALSSGRTAAASVTVTASPSIRTELPPMSLVSSSASCVNIRKAFPGGTEPSSIARSNTSFSVLPFTDARKSSPSAGSPVVLLVTTSSLNGDTGLPPRTVAAFSRVRLEWVSRTFWPARAGFTNGSPGSLMRRDRIDALEAHQRHRAAAHYLANLPVRAQLRPPDHLQAGLGPVGPHGLDRAGPHRGAEPPHRYRRHGEMKLAEVRRRAFEMLARIRAGGNPADDIREEREMDAPVPDPAPFQRGDLAEMAAGQFPERRPGGTAGQRPHRHRAAEPRRLLAFRRSHPFSRRGPDTCNFAGFTVWRVCWDSCPRAFPGQGGLMTSAFSNARGRRCHFRPS